jgi:hypothetical protein
MPKLATGRLAVNWGWLVYRIVDGEASQRCFEITSTSRSAASLV